MNVVNNALSRPVAASAVVTRGGMAMIVALATLGGWSPSANAHDKIVKVEEDWEMVLYEPNSAVNSPQFHTVMSPTGDMNSYYVQISWNYWEYQDYRPGGLQIQVWNGEHFFSDLAYPGANLSDTAETIRWTQVLSVKTGTLAVGIENGNSSTWGAFGGDDMKLHGNLGIDNLNAYKRDVSVKNSLITFGSNRVSMLVLKQVRKYSSEGLVSVDNHPKVVFLSSRD